MGAHDDAMAGRVARMCSGCSHKQPSYCWRQHTSSWHMLQMQYGGHSPAMNELQNGELGAHLQSSGGTTVQALDRHLQACDSRASVSIKVAAVRL